MISALNDRDTDFVFAHYNETDAVGHLFGPFSQESQGCYVETDRLIGQIREALAEDWSRLVLIVLSDHGMEDQPGDRIDLLSFAEVWEIVSETVDDGGCSLVRLRADIDPGEAGTILIGVPGVARVHPGSPGDLVVEAVPGVYFGGSARKDNKGGHGGSTTCRTLAIVDGGHPAVRRIAESIASRPPELVDWAPTIGRVLELEVRETEGMDLGTVG